MTTQKKCLTRFFLIVLLNLFEQPTNNAQNLVPNPSFEIVTNCDTLYNGIYYGFVPPWDTPTTGSSDFFNPCATINAANMSVPSNYFGYQYPHSGNGYAGEGVYCLGCGGTEIKEYLQVELDSTLIAQKEYCASFYVALCNKARIASNNLGMYFSNTHTFINAFQGVLNFTPQINDTNIISDTLNWTLISGQFIANGGERYLIIGNFYADSLTDTLHINVNGASYVSYYYIDDVSVFEMKKANAGRDTTICHGDSVQLGAPTCLNVSYNWQPTNGLSNPNISNPWAKPLTASASTTYYLTQTTPCGVSMDTVVVTLGNCWEGIGELGVGGIEIYPNPANDRITIETKQQTKATLKIINVLGELVFTSTTANPKTEVNTATYPSGVYFINLQTATQSINRKFVKE